MRHIRGLQKRYLKFRNHLKSPQLKKIMHLKSNSIKGGFIFKFMMFFLLLIFTGCGDRGYKVTTVHRQKIKNSTKAIFNYQAWSTLNDGAKYGYAVLDENDSVHIAEIERKSFRLFSRPPSKDSIFVINFKGNQSKPSIVTRDFKVREFEKYKGFTIQKDTYKFKLRQDKLTYHFADFKETDSHLKILGIDKIHLDLPFDKNEINFLKGNIKLIESKSQKGYLKQIEIQYLLLNSFCSGAIDNITIIRTKTAFHGHIQFVFIPTRPIKIADFSDIGIYKPIKVENVYFVN